MTDTLLEFFRYQRRIFCLCPQCHSIERLSNYHLYLKARPVKDWMDLLEMEDNRLQEEEQIIEDKRQTILDKARQVGRNEAGKEIKKIDKVFSPRKMNADDAKVIFHPIDFIVFDGMKSDVGIEKILLLDRKRTLKEQSELQLTIKKTIEKERYEWQTLRINYQGQVGVDEG